MRLSLSDTQTRAEKEVTSDSRDTACDDRGWLPVGPSEIPGRVGDRSEQGRDSGSAIGLVPQDLTQALPQALRRRRTRL